MDHPIGRRKAKALESRDDMICEKLRFIAEVVEVAKCKNEI